MEGKVRMHAKRVSNTEEVVAMNSAPVKGKMDFCSALSPCRSQTTPTSKPIDPFKIKPPKNLSVSFKLSTKARWKRTQHWYHLGTPVATSLANVFRSIPACDEAVGVPFRPPPPPPPPPPP